MSRRWQIILAIDSDRWACETYRANFPGAEVRCASVAEQNALEAIPYADAYLGGPPCQPHSHAGNRLASKDARDCGPDFVGAVEFRQPRMFLMENVDGLLTSENGRYWQRLYKSFEDSGYVVEFRVLDAVNFGVPQFRRRLWAWGIRRDLYVDGIRHRWPKATHAWPPPGPCMFGAALLPGVTVGQALGIDGAIRHVRGVGVIRRDYPTSEPSPTIYDLGGTGTGLQFVYDHGTATLDAPCPTIKAGGNYDQGGKQGGGCPPAIEYRWSDAMLEKHPPASPASPAPTVQAKYYKGGAEGLLAVDAPAHTLSRQSREPIQNWKGKGYVRRLTPLECLRLQSGPDDFRWPEGISKTQMYRVTGNGWASTMGAVFAAAFAAADPDSHTVIDLFCGGGLGAVGWHDRHWSYQPESEVASA